MNLLKELRKRAKMQGLSECRMPFLSPTQRLSSVQDSACSLLTWAVYSALVYSQRIFKRLNCLHANPEASYQTEQMPSLIRSAERLFYHFFIIFKKTLTEGFKLGPDSREK